MSLPVVFRPEARAEYDEAFDWFEQLRPGAGVAFAEAVQRTLDVIAAHPKMHSTVHQGVRRSPVGGYPYYRVFYRERTDHVEVIAVFHTSRNPADWHGRV